MKNKQTLDEKIAEAKTRIEKRDEKGKFRKQTIVERCGFWTVAWIIFWAVAAGASWTFVYDRFPELLSPRTVEFRIERAQAYIEPQKEDKPQETQNKASESESAKTGEKIAEFSAYNAEEAQTDSDPFTMASGKKVYEGAVANNCLPFGTKIKVNGKIKIVEDRMNERYDCDHFDIFMQNHDEAVSFGRKMLSYEIIK